jgi:hypothetical protein
MVFTFTYKYIHYLGHPPPNIWLSKYNLPDVTISQRTLSFQIFFWIEQQKKSIHLRCAVFTHTHPPHLHTHSLGFSLPIYEEFSDFSLSVPWSPTEEAWAVWALCVSYTLGQGAADVLLVQPSIFFTALHVSETEVILKWLMEAELLELEHMWLAHTSVWP